MFLMAVAVACFSSCDDQWEDEDVSGTRSQSLWEVISTREDLSQFKDVLVAGGYDEVLSSAGIYTVLAPNNEVMQTVASDHVSEVPGAHITVGQYTKAMLDTMTYLPMYNGKLAVLDSMHLNDEEIVCRNGILRFSATASSNVPNIYEQLFALKDQYKMAAFIIAQGDSIERVIDYIDNNTGKAVKDTILEFQNPLLDILPINNNDSLLSMVLVDDATYDALVAKYWKYMKQYDPVDPASNDFNIDTVATDQVVQYSLVQDLTCRQSDAQKGAAEYVGMSGVRLTMDTATVTEVFDLANGNIQIVSGLGIRIKDNKIKDVYVQGEDYYFTNETYVYTRIRTSSMGGKDVVVCGADTIRGYYRYYTYQDSITGETVMTDSIIWNTSTKVIYDAGNTTAVHKRAVGGAILGYKVPLYACKYKIYWRSVDDCAHHCNPDTTAVDYPKYLENPNYPCGGVLRHIQKMYVSMPGEPELEYNSNTDLGDFVLNYAPNNRFSGTYKNYRCMVGYDPEAENSELNAKSNFARIGVNAGVGTTDPTYETPLIWCKTATPDMSATYFSGVLDISVNEKETYNAKTGKPILVPKDVFLNFYHGDATVFVTSGVFNQTNRTASAQTLGMIYLDYIHFVPEIDE